MTLGHCQSLLLSHVALPPPSCLPRSILHTLRVRYSLDSIYTYSGNILIAVSAPCDLCLQLGGHFSRGSHFSSGS